MEDYSELVRRLIRHLEEAGVDYAFTGALAVSYYGNPRTTMDVDVLVAVTGSEDEKIRVIQALRRAGLQITGSEVDSALSSGYHIVSLRDEASPFTVDVILNHGKIEKRRGKVAEVDAFLQAPEELILAKLRMITATLDKERSKKDEGDVRSILAFTSIDLSSLRKKAEQEGTLRVLENVLGF